MKKILILFFIYGSALAQNTEFEGFKFGIHSEDIKWLVPKAERASIKSYTRKNDPIMRKYLFLSEVVYSFNDNKLYMIILTSRTNRMSEELQSQYGMPSFTPDNKMYWERNGLRINAEYQNGTYAYFIFDIESFKKVLMAHGAIIK